MPQGGRGRRRRRSGRRPAHARFRRRRVRGGRRRRREEPAAADGVHQRAAAGAGEGVPLQEVPVAHRALADRACAQAERGAGEDLVPEPARQVETGQSRKRQQQIRGAVPEPQNSRSHPGAREPLRNKESAPADGAGQTVEEEETSGEPPSKAARLVSRVRF